MARYYILPAPGNFYCGPYKRLFKAQASVSFVWANQQCFVHIYYPILFSHHIHDMDPSFSLSLLVVTQIRGHIAGSSPPLPTTVRALHSYRDNSSALPSSIRLDLCLPTLGALSSCFYFLFLHINSKSHHVCSFFYKMSLLCISIFVLLLRENCGRMTSWAAYLRSNVWMGAQSKDIIAETAEGFFRFVFSSHSPFVVLLVLPLQVVTQIRGHIVGSSPPSPLRYVPCMFIARRIQHFLSSSIRVEFCLPALLSALSAVGVIF